MPGGGQPAALFERAPSQAVDPPPWGSSVNKISSPRWRWAGRESFRCMAQNDIFEYPLVYTSQFWLQISNPAGFGLLLPIFFVQAGSPWTPQDRGRGATKHLGISNVPKSISMIPITCHLARLFGEGEVHPQTLPQIRPPPVLSIFSKNSEARPPKAPFWENTDRPP